MLGEAGTVTLMVRESWTKLAQYCGLHIDSSLSWSGNTVKLAATPTLKEQQVQ